MSGYLGREVADLAALSAMELATWRAFDAQGGFGESRMDLRFAKMTAHLVAAIPFGKARSVRVDDYLLADGVQDEAMDDSTLFDSFDARRSDAS